MDINKEKEKLLEKIESYQLSIDKLEQAKKECLEQLERLTMEEGNK